MREAYRPCSGGRNPCEVPDSFLRSRCRAAGQASSWCSAHLVHSRHQLGFVVAQTALLGAVR